MRSFLILVGMAAAGWAATTVSTGAVSKGGPPPAKAGASQKAASQGAANQGATQARSDAAIEKEIRARFAKSKIGVEKFQVHVQGGVATIEGKTNVVQHKGVATRLARSGGAVAVANHIEISEAAREKAAQNLETGRRRAQVKHGEERSEPRSETANVHQSH